MPQKVSKDGNRVVIVEYEVREVDEFGDAIDTDHYETETEALQAAEKSRWSEEAAAVVVEKHTSRRPSRLYDKPDTYETVHTSGDEQALRYGGWLDA